MSGKCVMRGSCGPIDWSGQQLPCPYDGPAVEPETDALREKLVTVCPNYVDGPVCCTSDQVDALQANLQQAEALISSCPACRNNFRDFFCSFTCSPNQATFLNVSSTQESNSGEVAVKSAEFFVGEEFGAGFFQSCKDIKFGATNGYAMDLLGGGAKTYPEFLRFMGDVRPGLGSPFQINFPNETDPDFVQFNPTPRKCSDFDLSSRCTCSDCPTICPTLPTLTPPNSQPGCHVGLLSCLSFILILAYTLGITGFAGGYGFISTYRKRNRYGRIALVNGAETPSSGLVGASSLAAYHDDSVSESRQSLGRGASLLDPEGLQPQQYRLSMMLRRFFYRLGYTCASNPFITFVVALVFIAVSNTGWKFFDVEKDPVRLWVSLSSESRVQKEFFDENFGPFYRVQQIFVTPSPTPPIDSFTLNPIIMSGSWTDEPVLTFPVLRWWSDIEAKIKALRSRDHGYGLEDVCFSPTGPGGPCVVQSVLGWFENELGQDDEDTWKKHLVGCANQPSACLPDFGQPLQPTYVLGGVPDSAEASRWLEAASFVTTYVISDSLDPEIQAKAEEWEVKLRGFLEDLSLRAPREAGVQISFSTGVSLEEELNKSTNTDVKIVILSYLAMFLYVSLSLGRGDDDWPGVFTYVQRWISQSRRGLQPSSASATSSRGIRPFLRRIFVGSKVMLALSGLLLVLVSIASAVGIFSFAGVKVTLIIAEVIPFLVLAVGVDNVFLLLGEVDRQNSFHGPNASAVPPNAQLATPMSPSQRYRSPFGSSHDSGDAEDDSAPPFLPAEERVARALSNMGPSILISSGTQTLAFALGAFVPMPAVRNFALYAALSVLLNGIFQVTVLVSALTLDLKRTESGRVDCFPFIKIPAPLTLSDGVSSTGGTLTRFMRRVYAPFLLHPTVKGAVLAIFSGIAVLAVISIQHIELGLDQRLALPSDSYLVRYFDAVQSFLDVGPPIYFVVQGTDVTSRRSQQQLCAKFTTCDDFSVANTLEAERKRPESSFISQPPAVWIDDFLHWLDPALETCCRVRTADPSVFCRSTDSERLCRPCLEGREPAWNITMEGLPESDEFNRYLSQWLDSPTNEDCPLGGQQAHKASLALEGGNVVASHFRTYHTPMRDQSDFINGFEAAHRIAADLSSETGAYVFPYSPFYVFFEQYSHIVGMTQEILGLGLAAVLIVTSALLGSWKVGTIVTTVVGLTVLSVMGIMGIWSISLNAVSLVNLVISLGIAVEFCSHIARSFVNSGSGVTSDGPGGQKERDERIFSTLVDVGPSVLSGITFTKLIGVCVLALTRSRLLEIYFFRMWLSLIVMGALHGLVLLPVLLSLIGGPSYALEDADEEWMSSAIRRHDFEYTPFLADTDSVLSD